MPYLDADGDPTDPTTPDTELSGDAGAFADATEEVTTITGSNGGGYLTLTGAETNYSAVMAAFKVASGPKATLATLYPRVLASVGTGTLSAGSAGGGTLGTLLAYDVTGCFIRTTGGTGGGGTGGANNQARKIATYNTGTGAFTVVPNWETTPSTDTTYEVHLPEGVTLGMLKALNPSTAGRTLQVESDGMAYADAREWLGGTIPAVNVTGVPKVDATHLLGTAWLTPGTAGTPDVNVKLWNALTTVALPLAPTTAGRTLDVSAGGEAGIDWANIGSPTTAVNLSATNIDVDQVIASVSGAVGSVTGAVGSVTGNVGGNVTGSVGTVNALAANVITAAATAADFGTEIGTAVWASATRTVTSLSGLTVDTVTTLTNLPAITANWLTAAGTAADFGTEVGTAVWASATRTVTSLSGLTVDTVTTLTNLPAITANWLTAAGIAADAGAEIADAVWDEAIAGHLTAGTTGAALNAAGSAGDPWTTPLPGAYGAGTAGKIVGDNINATISSRASQTSVDVVDDFLDTELAALTTTVTKHIPNRMTCTVAGHFERPESGSTVYKIEVRYYDTAGALYSGADVPTLTGVGGTTGSLAANIGAAVTVSTGIHTFDYTVSSAHNVEPVYFTATARLPDGNFVTSRYVQVTNYASQASVDTVDDFLDTEIAAIKAKTDNLPADTAADLVTINSNVLTRSTLTQAQITGGAYPLSNASAVLGDPAIAAIKAKTDLLPAVAAGSANGLLIAGSNAATTFASITSTGAFTISDGLLVSRSSANSPAISATGSGLGAGILVTGGNGAFSAGIQATSNSSSIGWGVLAIGTGTAGGAGVLLTAPASAGFGLKIDGGSTSGDAVRITATNGDGIQITGAGSGNYGMTMTGDVYGMNSTGGINGSVTLADASIKDATFDTSTIESGVPTASTPVRFLMWLARRFGVGGDAVPSRKTPTTITVEKADGTAWTTQTITTDGAGTDTLGRVA